ncbi:MAG: 16S rRNA (guanine(966)-N(2))-methyltransferase RsmD [Tannerellaceae bacterium]|jgi:16S rRNA (guanine(966)-N(2))-methyltransferase RsmD|nr:16S rRNA (guanine(966)-N(2))-methyltransferase RsmD [Tannerellaceae bacterium]
MRIISGKYGRRRFQVPPSFEARPTTDFAKENLFNVLANFVEFEQCKALDLFSGTGSIAFEFLSRGCPHVTAVEQNAAHAAFIARTAATLDTKDSFTLLRTDVFRFLRPFSSSAAVFDIVFADPPYTLPDLQALPDLLIASSRLSAGALIILEHPKAYDFSAHARLIDHRAYGSVNFSLFRLPPPSPPLPPQ